MSYLIAPEAYLAFGEAKNRYQIDFEEKSTGGTAMFEMFDERNGCKWKQRRPGANERQTRMMTQQVLRRIMAEIWTQQKSITFSI